MFIENKDNEQKINLENEELKPSALGNKLLTETVNELGLDIESLEESPKKMKKKDKIEILRGRAVSIIGRENNDPDYKKMMFHREKMLELKNKLRKKYDKLAVKRAKIAFKTGHLVEPTSAGKI